MRVLHIVPTYYPAIKRGGPIVSVHNLNKWLVKRGVEVTVFTTDIDTEGKVSPSRIKCDRLEGGMDLDGVKIHYFRASFPRVWEYWRIGFIPAFWSRHWEYSRDLHKALKIKVKEFDLVHITSTFLSVSSLGSYYARKNKKPYVISPRGNLMLPLELKNPIKKMIYISLFEKKYLKNGAIHFTVPQEETDYLRYGLPKPRLSFVIPNGLEGGDLKELPPKGYFRNSFGVGPNKKIVLFLGRLNWKKGFDTLIPAFSRVVREDQDAVLVIAGSDEGGYRTQIEKWIKKYSLEDKVIFTGLLTGKDKLGALQDSQVFVLPSYSENFGMSVVEAMYLGLPVVLTPGVGLASYAEEARAGFVVSKEEGAVAQAILRVFKNPEEARVMGERGSALAKEKFTSDKVADQFIAEYNKLIR